jgi:hypothetical protein
VLRRKHEAGRREEEPLLAEMRRALPTQADVMRLLELGMRRVMFVMGRERGLHRAMLEPRARVGP